MKKSHLTLRQRAYWAAKETFSAYIESFWFFTLWGLLVLFTILWGIAYIADDADAAPRSVSAAPAVSCPLGYALVVVPDGTWTCTPWPPPQPSSSATTTTRPPSTSTPAPTTTTQQPPVGEVVVQAYVTGFSWFDNTPPGSAAIAYPQVHSQAGGVGTYADPVTVAVGHTIDSKGHRLDWAAGTRFYIAGLHRYFIVEDACGDGSTPQNGPCHTGWEAHPPATTWLDVWVGGRASTSAKADSCMNMITKVYAVIVNPAAGKPVTSGDIAGASGCAP